MTYTFSSNFALHIENFIEQKHVLGYPYKGSIYILSTFDKFCVSLFPSGVTLTKEIGLAWATRKETENNNSFRNRMMPIRELARYMNRIGIEAYVIPSGLTKKSPRHVPHIYTQEELNIFFGILDQIPKRKNSPVRHLVIPTMFRVIYCCGLRPVEACKLHMENVDLLNGKIYILESKGHKDRIVMLSNDVLDLCRRYNETVCHIMPERKFFFPNPSGNIYMRNRLDAIFRRQWALTSIPQTGENAPRICDFRHSFATHRLYQWMVEGKKLYACLPYLSAYLGHVLLSDTAYYIHLVPEFFETMSSTLDFAKYEQLLPEVE